MQQTNYLKDIFFNGLAVMKEMFVVAKRYFPRKSLTGSTVQRTGILIALFLVPGMFVIDASAQAPFPPPNQLQVFPVQGLSFGDFFPSSSVQGTVTVDYNGNRTSDNVVAMGGIWHPAIFEIALIPGRQVSIMLGPEVQLAGSNGGTMKLKLDDTDRGSGFITASGHPFRNIVRVGGTLTVRGTEHNPPGSYSGEFSVTFIQE